MDLISNDVNRIGQNLSSAYNVVIDRNTPWVNIVSKQDNKSMYFLQGEEARSLLDVCAENKGTNTIEYAILFYLNSFFII